MKRVKQEKGITLIVLVITIIVMSIITVPIFIQVENLKQANDISKFKNDINVLSEAINQISTDNTLEIGPVFTGDVDFGSQKNPNDGTIYYVIDMDKLKNLYYEITKIQLDNLNFGKNNYNINYTETTLDSADVYIMNKDTHTVYYIGQKSEDGKYTGFIYNDIIY